jgi:ligand-binding sensor domain-containing protein/DNA-binding CsgD family transcriptional regulator
MTKNFSILLLIFLAATGILQSQVQKLGIPELEYFNRRMYNGGTQNWGVTQSETGFMYFANNDGVVEFDGVNWRIYTDLGSFNVRSVRAIDDKIYAGGYNKLGFFEYDSLCNLKYHSLSTTSDLRSLGDYWSIHNWNNQVIFHSQQGVCFFKNDSLQFILKSESRFIAAFVVNGMFLLLDEKQGLMEVRGSKVFPLAGGSIFAGMQITSIMPLSDSQIVVGTMNNGLYLWDMQHFKPWDVEANDLLKSINIFCGEKYNDDFLLFGTIQGGLVVTDLNGNVFMQVDKDKGLNNNTVLSLKTDKEGNIWAGLDNGIIKVNFNSSISFLQGYYNLGTGYVIDKFKEQYYFGTNQAIYTISDSNFKNPLKTRDDFIRVKGSEGQVWSFYHDENSLLCGHHLGVFEIVGDHANLITPAEVNGVWNFKKVMNHPDLLVSGSYTGLIIFQKKNGRWRFKNKIEGFHESARFIEWDNSGNLWVSHGYKGVFKLQISDDFKSVEQVDLFPDTFFPGNHYPLVLSKVNGECAFSSSDGVFRMDSSANSFVRDKEYDHIFKKGMFPKYIMEDQYKNQWYFFEGRTGVLRYLEDGSYKRIEYPFMSLDRKLVNSFEFVHVVDQDNVFFGIEDGFAHYSAKDFKNYKIPFRVHIRSFKGNNDSTVYQLNESSDQCKQELIPEFLFAKNAFEIDYAASFHERREVLYSTFLKGYDLDFSQWGPENNRSIANLYEGEYEFVVKAKNKYGVEAPEVKFKFVVLPPWYRSNLAKVFFIFLFICIFLLLFFAFNRRVEMSKRREKLMQQERFKIKEEKLKTAALVSEKEMIRMRNEKLRSEMVFKEKELANSTVNLIQKNDLLTDIKSQLKRMIKISEKNELDKKVRILINKIDRDIDNDNNWEVFEMHFGQVHEAFFQKLKTLHPDLNSREQKLCAYIKMGMASKDIASLMNITTRAVENNRYKLRQKLGINHGDNLLGYIESI